MKNNEKNIYVKILKEKTKKILEFDFSDSHEKDRKFKILIGKEDDKKINEYNSFDDLFEFIYEKIEDNLIFVPKEKIENADNDFDEKLIETCVNEINKEIKEIKEKLNLEKD